MQFDIALQKLVIALPDADSVFIMGARLYRFNLPQSRALSGISRGCGIQNQLSFLEVVKIGKPLRGAMNVSRERE